MKKNIFFTLVFFVTTIIFGVILGTDVQSAGTKKIGDACSDDAQCESNKCWDSYCMCNDTTPSNHCAATYGGATPWKCILSGEDPNDMRDEWNFCKKSTFVGSYPQYSTEDVKYPVEQKKMMGHACNDDDGCWDPTGTAGNCQQSAIPSAQTPQDPHYDPWYAQQKNLKVCAVKSIATVQSQCEYQYGSGSYTFAEGTGELSGLYVCQKNGSPAFTTLAQMRNSVVQDSEKAPDTTIFGFGANMPEMKFVTPTPKIGIPGVVFSNITKESHITTDELGASWLNIPFLGEYIAAIYKYSVGLISLIAVLVLIVSGVQITTSAGNSETISGAKHRITSAVIAIILTAGSYTILYTINPELVNLRSLRILLVEGQDSPFVADQHTVDGGDGELTDTMLSEPAITNNSGKIRYQAPKNSDASYLVDCSAFPNYQLRGKTNDPSGVGAKARENCRKTCIQQLETADKSIIANASYNSKYLGYLDCSSQGSRSLSTIKYIAVHEGAPTGALPHWWGLITTKQLPIGSHYFITRDGTIYQVLDERFKIWHGVLNASSIGVDLDGGCSSASATKTTSQSCSYTDAQYTSLNRLINDIEGRIGHQATILGHCDVGDPSNADAHIDPRMFDWSRIGESNATHKRGKCLYVPGFELGSVPTTPPFGSKK